MLAQAREVNQETGQDSATGTELDSHRLVMPPDTVAMEKHSLPRDDHPSTSSLQRSLEKEFRHIRKQE
jgi:hypothetical protein